MVNLPSAVIKFIEEQEEMTERIASRATELHSQRSQLVRNCSCSKHSCDNDFDEFVCSLNHGTPSFCEVEGRRLDYNSTTIRTPSGANPFSLSPALKESLCIYKHIEDVMIDPNNTFGWVYMGTRYGDFREFPGNAFFRNVEGGIEELNNCKLYDPRIRPWFIGATTGPKDIVLVVDISGSMNDIIGSNDVTKWDVTKRAVLDILDTFTFTDYVNIVAFSDSAETLWKDPPMARGTEENLGALKKLFDELYPSGDTNFVAGLEEAFSLLDEGCDGEAACSDCQKIILFLTDGQDRSGPNNSPVQPSRIQRIIERNQQSLEKRHGHRASIFTYSMTENADDQIPRQIACQNNGSWSFIDPNRNTLDALNSYYLFVTRNSDTAKPIWVEPYEDANGLGLITTVAMPFYAKGTTEVPDVFLGVVGNDVGLHELQIEGVTYDQVLDSLIDRSLKCILPKISPCELQVYRTANDERSQCPDIIPEELESQCFAHKESYYRRFSELVDRATAASRCESEGGLLVSIEDKEELAFVSSLATADGCWIGLSRNGVTFYWSDSSLPSLSAESNFWGVGEPSFTEGESCVSIDSRGVINNLAVKNCASAKAYICKFESEDSCPDGLASRPDKGYYSVPPESACSSDEIFVQTRPIEEAVDLKNDRIVCPVEGKKSNKETICCSVPESSSSSWKTWHYVLIAVGGFVVVVGIWCWSYRKKISVVLPKKPSKKDSVLSVSQSKSEPK